MEKRILAILCTFIMCFSMVGCVKSQGPNIDNSTNDAVVVDDVLEDNYTYMWHRDGVGGTDNTICFQSEKYYMTVDGYTGKLTGLSNYDGSQYKLADFDKINRLESHFYIKNDDRYISTTDLTTSSRILESGRYVNRLDSVGLTFDGEGISKYGRTEYVGTQDYIAVNFELYSDVADVFDMKIILAFDGFTFSNLSDNRGVKACDANGNCFAFIKQTSDSAANISYSDNEIAIEQKNINIPVHEFTGFGFFIIPMNGGNNDNLNIFFSTEKTEVSVKDKNNATLPVRHDSSDGINYVDLNSLITGPQNISANRLNYDIASLTITNRQSDKASPIICFVKEGDNLSATGVSPMLTDSVYQEPTGEQVQISKNWHFYDDSVPDDSNVRLYEGRWYHGFSQLDVNANDTESRVYKCAYGQWGQTYSASHAQLCLVGWGGDQLWDQSALGSWGESVTYDVDQCLGRAMIDDVRPFLVRSTTGNNEKFSWSGNVGGADFLNYQENGTQKIINQRVTYKTQAPNITQVNYKGETENKKIATDISINLGRTDDVVRNYYTIKYIFLDDVEYSRLSLFKIAADGYADNQFKYYAYGDDSGIIEEEKLNAQVLSGYDNGNTKTALNDNFWFGLYGSSSADEYGDPMFVVRSFNAVINGKSYSKPGYNFYGTDNHYRQMSCEITIPDDVGTIVKKGSIIEMVIEYTILPNNISSYYGESDYLNQSSDIIGTASAFYQQTIGSKQVADVIVGKLVKNYPLTIEADTSKGSTVAQFKLNGGLGYVPLIINGLDNLSYKLQVKSGESWHDVDQAVNGNDFWQAYKNASTNDYELAYNIKNTIGLAFNVTNEYRLIKK